MREIAVAAALALGLLAACGTNGVESGSSIRLTGSTWRLAELRSSDDAIGVVHPDDPDKHQMTLGEDGSVALRLDCNRGTGRWTSAAANPMQGTIAFTPLAMTRAACPAGSLDTRIVRELAYVRTYLFEGERLILIMMADGGTQAWSRAAE